jgi:type II/III secretion system protein
VSRLTGFTPGDNQPIIDTNSASTTLSVANRQTVVIGGLRQRGETGEFNGIPYLKDLHVVGRLFRSRDTDVRESELVVFISPEIISYDDAPNCRQRLCEETIRCRLDQIPEAEGCPPCCRRLPPEAIEEQVPTPAGEPDSAGGDATTSGGPKSPVSKPIETATLKQPDSFEPLSAAHIPSAEFQFGAAGQNEKVRALVAEGKLRRLPLVLRTDAQVAAAVPAATNLFAAPPATLPTLGPVQGAQPSTAYQGEAPPLRR